MKRGLVIALIGSCALLISCAHKNKGMTPGEQTKTTEQKKSTDKDSKKAGKLLVKKDQKMTTDGSDLAYTCNVAGDKRTVKMDKSEKRCEVHYTRDGQTQQVAWGEAHPEICKNTFDQIRNNIEGRGFKCENGLGTDKDKRETASSK